MWCCSSLMNILEMKSFYTDVSILVCLSTWIFLLQILLKLFSFCLYFLKISWTFFTFMLRMYCTCVMYVFFRSYKTRKQQSSLFSCFRLLHSNREHKTGFLDWDPLGINFFCSPSSSLYLSQTCLNFCYLVFTQFVLQRHEFVMEHTHAEAPCFCAQMV